MKGSLLSRNLGLLVGVVLAGQLLAGLMVLLLVIQPQTVRVADTSARMLDAVSIAMEGQPAQARARIVQRINGGGSIRLRPLDQPPDAGGRALPNFLERMFMRSLARRMQAEELAWRTSADGHLWMLLQLGGDEFWVNMTPPRMAGPLLSLVVASLIAFIVAAAGGLVLQRRLNRPLQALERAVAEYRPGGDLRRIDTDGPREIAAVAHALDGMATRIAAQEQERALMLAGVSHDLRTPLARLRLSVEMMPHQDEDLRASAHRQIEQIDHMLGQFLDFARVGKGEEPTRIGLARLLTDAVEDSGMAGQVAVAAPPGLTATVRPLAMRRAVRNLIENAARYGAPPITVSAMAVASGADLRVTDGGTGFDPALAAHLLKPFAKADGARSSEGTGLGLAIADRIVRDHGGTLSFARGADGFSAVIHLPG